MIKLNVLAFTLMIQVHKRALTVNEVDHELRLRQIHDQNLDRKTQKLYF